VHDELTQVHNRRYFDRAMQREVNRARRHEEPLSLFLFDIDDFKSYNDSFGHREGDDLLRRVGRLLLATFRSEDVPCRYGGEEFVVILPETDAAHAHLVAERFRETIARLDGPRKATISGGIAEFPVHGVEPGALFLQADRTMYRAKAEGKDRILIAS